MLARRVRLLRQLRGPGELVLLVRIVGFAASVPLLLRLPLSRLGNLIEPHRRAQRPRAGEADKIIRLVPLALRLGSPLTGRGCLTRGLTLYRFLRAAGVDVCLYFGMGKVDGQFEGHCWLVKDGEPILESRDPCGSFTPMHRFPAPEIPLAGKGN